MTAYFLSTASLSREASAKSIVKLLNPLDPGRAIDAHHQLIWSLFVNGDNPSSQARDFLWREDDKRFLILSARPPVDNHAIFDIQTRRFEPGITEGETLRFRLRANATICRSTGKGEKRTQSRHDIVMDTLLMMEKDNPEKKRHELREIAVNKSASTWFDRVGERSGFELTNLESAQYQTIKLPRKGKQAAAFGRLDLDGVLRVTDADSILQSVLRGLGRSKAFGCGLLLLKSI